MDFHSFVRSLGLIPKSIVADGRWRRCGTEDKPRGGNGAYKLAADGRVGWVQDWATMTEPAMWRPDRQDMPAFDPHAFRRAREEAEAAQRKATADARAFYERCQPLRGGHPYLTAHDLDMRGCHGLKVDEKGWLVVPAYDHSQVRSVQRISPEGDKRFWPGASVAGTIYPVSRRGAQITILAEGLATGLACFAAVPNSCVIVAWNAGNLAGLTSIPPGFAVIAADNDHETAQRIGENPGIKAALKAADALGCGVAYPEGIQGTDWADYRQQKVRERMGTKAEFETEAQVRKTVDAAIRRALMREAKFVRRLA